MKIILMGEPMGLFMANETGSLSEVNTFTASIAGAEYNVAVGLARLGHTPAYCTRLGFDPLGERILNGMRKNAIATDLNRYTYSAQTGFMMKGFTQKATRTSPITARAPRPLKSPPTTLTAWTSPAASGSM